MSRLFGRKLAEARAYKKITQAVLGELVGSSAHYVSQLELKVDANPSANMVFELAAALGCGAKYLIDDKQAVLTCEAMTASAPVVPYHMVPLLRVYECRICSVQSINPLHECEG